MKAMLSWQSRRYWPGNMVRNFISMIMDGYKADLLKVVVEKPFTISTTEADRVIAAQKKSGKILTVFQSISSLRSIALALLSANMTCRPSI